MISLNNSHTAGPTPISEAHDRPEHITPAASSNNIPSGKILSFHHDRPSTPPEPALNRAVVGGNLAESNLPPAGASQAEALRAAKSSYGLRHGVPYGDAPVQAMMAMRIGGSGFRPYHTSQSNSSGPTGAPSEASGVTRASIADDRRRDEHDLDRLKDESIRELFRAPFLKGLPEALSQRISEVCSNKIDLFTQMHPGVTPVLVYIPNIHTFAALTPEDFSKLSIENLRYKVPSSKGSDGQMSQRGGKGKSQQGQDHEGDRQEPATILQALAGFFQSPKETLIRLLKSVPENAHPNIKAETSVVDLLYGMATGLTIIADEFIKHEPDSCAYPSYSGRDPRYSDTAISELRGDITVLAQHLKDRDSITAQVADAFMAIAKSSEGLSEHAEVSTIQRIRAEIVAALTTLRSS